MPVLLHPETGLAQDFPTQEAADAAAQSGFRVPLVDADGNPQGVPAHEYHQAIEQGMRPASPDQLQSLLDAAQYGSGPQSLLAGLEGAAEPLTFGASAAAEPALGLSSKEAIRKRSEQNPGSHLAGEAAGVAAGLLLTHKTGIPSVPGAISEAGQAVGRAAEGLGATGLLGKAVRGAASGAVEGGLLGGSHAVSEKLLGDPNVTAEGILSQVGLSTVLGGGLGMALTPAIEGLGAAARHVFPDLGAPAESLAGQPATLEQAFKTGTYDDAERSRLLDGLTKLKDHVGDIDAAGEALDAPVSEGQRSASKLVQDTYSALTKSPSAVGVRQQQMVDAGFNKVREALTGVLGDASAMTEDELGGSLKRGITESLEAERKPLSDLYELHREKYGPIPLSDETKDFAVHELREIPELSPYPGHASDLYLKAVESRLRGAQTVDDLRALMAEKVHDPALSHAKGLINSALEGLEQKAIVDGAGPEFASEAQSLRKTADSGWKQFRGTLQDLGDVLGKKKFYGPRDFLAHLDNLPNETLVKKLFQKENGEFLRTFADRFPNQAEALAQYQRGQIAEKAFKDGRISPTEVLKQVDKLKSGAREFLFTPEQVQTLEHAKTWVESLPKDVNPSGTAKALTLMEWLKNPASVAVTHAADLAKLKFIQSVVNKAAPGEAPLVATLMHLKSLASKTARAVEEGASAIFSRVGTTPDSYVKLPRLLPPSASGEPRHDETTQNVIDHAADPMRLADHMAQGTEAVAPHAPDTSTALTAATSRAVQFLASKVPNTDKPSPLSQRLTATPAERAKFHRYVQVVSAPTSVLGRVKGGTVSRQDVEALQAVYPALYQHMQVQVTGALSKQLAKGGPESVPYRTRMALSTFLGQPLDSSLTPQGLLSRQASAAPQPQVPPQGAGGPARPSKAGIGKMKFVQADMTPADRASYRHSR